MSEPQAVILWPGVPLARVASFGPRDWRVQQRLSKHDPWVDHPDGLCETKEEAMEQAPLLCNLF